MINVRVTVTPPAVVTGRNGTTVIGDVHVHTHDANGDGTVFLDFISRKKGVRLNAGAHFNANAMDQIAEEWLRARGRL